MIDGAVPGDRNTGGIDLGSANKERPDVWHAPAIGVVGEAAKPFGFPADGGKIAGPDIAGEDFAGLLFGMYRTVHGFPILAKGLPVWVTRRPWIYGEHRPNDPVCDWGFREGNLPGPGGERESVVAGKVFIRYANLHGSAAYESGGWKFESFRVRQTY